MKTNNFFNYKIFADDILNITIDMPLVISTLNPYSFLISEKEPQFKNALLNSNILIPDGQGIVWATKLLYNKKIKRIAGYDIFIYLMNILNKKKGRCFFLGSTKDTLSKIKKKIGSEFSNALVETYCPPFKEAFDSNDNLIIIDKINKYQKRYDHII